MRWDCGGCPPTARDDRRLYSHATFYVKIEHLNDASSHFKLAWSVFKIASFEFANLQCFNSTFMNLKIYWVVLNAKYAGIVVFTQRSRK